MRKLTNTSNNQNIDWLFGNSPSSIERQEKQGQQELSQSSQLPFEVNGKTNYDDVVAEYLKIGIKALKQTPDDPIFVEVQMPTGWQIKPTDHSMWSNLIDDKGRVRAEIFYKAAFYDRSSFIRFRNRYVSGVEYKDKDTVYYVKDNYTSTYIFEEVLSPVPPNKDYYEKHNNFRSKCESFLKEKFPYHEDFTAYWD